MNTSSTILQAVRPRSLKARLTLSIVSIFLLAIWSLTFYISHLLREDMTRLLGEQQLSTASFIASDIDDSFKHRFATLTRAAETLSTALSDPLRLQTRLESVDSLSMLFNGGAIVTRLDGKGIASSPASLGRTGQDFSGRPYFPEAISGKNVIGPPMIGRNLHKPVFAMAVPVRDSDGRVIGTLAGITNLALPSFLDLISATSYGKSGGYMLVAHDSRLVVTATDPKRIMNSLAGGDPDSLLGSFLRGYEGYGVTVNPLGVQMLVASRNVPTADWHLSVALPTAEAFAPIRSLQRSLVFGTLLLSLLAGAATWLIVRRQLRPMVAAAESMRAMTEGSQRVTSLPIDRPDEVGVVVNSFNRLVQTIARREDALRASEQRARAIIEAAPVPISVVDADKRISYLNTAFTAAVGYTIADIPTIADWFMLAYPDPLYREQVRKQIVEERQHVPRTNLPHGGGERRVTCKDGVVRTFTSRRGSLIDGETTPTLIVLHDITARKQAEAELERYRDHLEDLVAARTGELALANEEAEAARRASIERMRLEAESKMESRKLEAVGTLAAGIAHDFNNILASIVGFAEMTADDLPEGSQAHNNVVQIVSASFRARDLVARMLTFARQSPAEPVLVDIVNETSEALLLLRASLPPSIELAFQNRLGDQAWARTVSCDPTQIQQIVMNLCINASHAMSEHGTIHVGLGPSSAMKDAAPGLAAGLCLSVSDTGNGMLPEVLDRMFDPFFTTREPGKGSGLGLSVVYGIVTSLGGRIDVQSRTGTGTGTGPTGTEFHVFLPTGMR